MVITGTEFYIRSLDEIVVLLFRRPLHATFSSSKSISTIPRWILTIPDWKSGWVTKWEWSKIKCDPIFRWNREVPKLSLASLGATRRVSKSADSRYDFVTSFEDTLWLHRFQTSYMRTSSFFPRNSCCCQSGYSRCPRFSLLAINHWYQRSG